MTIALALGAVIAAGLAAAAASPRFFADDPIWRDDDTVEDASGVRPWKIQAAYVGAESTFTDPGDAARNVRAQNVNTVDEVPDSSWFSNRIGSRHVTAEEVAKGGWSGSGPAEGQWTVTDGKSDGISPGFTVTDPAGARWFLKFDADEHPGMASGSEVVTSRLLWLLGYNVPEYHVVAVRRQQLVVGEGARVQPPGAYTRGMRAADLDVLLADAARNADGSFRAVASRALPGTPLGGFRFHGTRPDDPNDIVPHEHRRELRGLLVFSAWLNHVEAGSSNTLDTLVQENGRTFVRHHLLDFGATLGSGTLAPQEYWKGFDHLVDFGQAVKGIASFGFYVLPWRTVPFHESASVGRIPAVHDSWDPDTWKPSFPNAAFKQARADDRFWAARKLMAVTDDLIRAAVQDGAFPEPASEETLVMALAGRRDAILRRYLAAVNPVVDPALDRSGTLTFWNAAQQAGVTTAPDRYHVAWFLFDNLTGESRPVGQTGAHEARVQAPGALPDAPGAFVRADITATAPATPAWSTPVRAYFQRTPAGDWKLVGVERLPAAAGPAS